MWCIFLFKCVCNKNDQTKWHTANQGAVVSAPGVFIGLICFFLLFILYVVGFRTYSHQLSELYNALDTTRNHKHAQALHDLPAVTRNVRHDGKMRDCCHNKQRTFYLKTDQQRTICSWQERPVPLWECLVSQLCKMGLIKAGGGCAQEICWIQEMERDGEERTTVAIYVFAHGCRH